MAKILIVDDSKPIRRLVAYLLEVEGHETDEAVNGLHALERFAACPSDMILMDLDMPCMNGWETCRHLRRMSQVPILIMSGNAHSLTGEQTLACGANAFLPKPLELDDLLNWVRRTSGAGLRMARGQRADAVSTH